MFQAALDSAHRRDLQHATKVDTPGPEPMATELSHGGEEVDAWPVYRVNAPMPATHAEELPDGIAPSASRVDIGTHPAMPLPDEEPAIVQMPRTFDFVAFIEELQQAGNGDLRSFQDWLENHLDLYSLLLKQELAWPLVHHLVDAAPPLRPKWLAALLAFFSLDAIGPRLHELNHLVHAARLHSENYWLPELVAERIQHGRASLTDQELFRELQGPPSLPRRAFILFFPGLKKRIHEIAEELSATAPENQRRIVDPVAVDFWLGVGNRHAVSGWRMATMLLQLAAFAVFLRLLMGEGGLALAIIVAVVWLLWLAAAANNARVLRRVRDTGVLPAVRWWQRNWKWLMLAWIVLQVARLLAG